MALYEMDAVHHVQEGVNYPAVICMGGMNDGRVVVWQSAKFAAALQNASMSGRPVLMQVNYSDGHLASSRTMANILAFGLWQAGHPAFQPVDSNQKR
ncbi:prolyl oligopeptidase family serine peptidase [Spirosoma sp. KNUC1025]|uniref:prolyl oligopeptidase family serine peptidase n=1 Tax=Spirosoma sp. KNUC1025 TaxID=2894082 RepID=UPI00386F71AC